MTQSPALTLARDRLKLIRNHTSVNPHQIEIIDEALAAIDAELAASADAGRLDIEELVVRVRQETNAVLMTGLEATGLDLTGIPKTTEHAAAIERFKAALKALRLAALARPAPATMANGLTESETSATASVAGLSVSAQGDERAAFERYFADSRRAKHKPTFSRVEDGTYTDDHTQRHWWTWQNALKAARAQVAQGDEVDAARYREWQRLYLSAGDTDDDANLVLSVAETPEEIDAALDAARAQQGGQP